MNKPIYKCATIWGVLGGTALAYLYFKTLGKDKNLQLDKVLMIGGMVGGGFGILIDLATKKPKTPVTEEELKDLAKTINNDTELELNSYLPSIQDENISTSEKQNVLNVLNKFLLAKKDGKWDTKGDIETKKKVLISYGASQSEVNSFESTLKDHLINSISDMMKNETKK